MGNEYSRAERWMANMVERFPNIKRKVKKGYQRLNFSLHKRNYTYQSAYPLHTIPLESETFFGYYDKSPLSQDGRYILFHEAIQATNLLPDPNQKINVCVFDKQTEKVIFRLPTFSYNWQQGARAQWLNEKKFVFNEYDQKLRQYQATVFNLMNNQKDTIPYPVYDCFKDHYALSLNFKRLMALRPDYGYRNETRMADSELKNIEDDGIFYMDLSTGESKLLVSLSNISQINSTPGMDNALHKVNHIMIAPDGGHFIFLHRYFIKGRRFDRLFVADRNGSNLKILADDDMVSHCCWLDNNHIAGYLRDKIWGDRYYRINIFSGKKMIIGKDKIDRYGDGHPSIFNQYMVFDTYPDKARMKHLFLYNMQTAQLKELGEFYESLVFYGESRCDLHPRFSYDGKFIFFDSVHEGARKLYWIKID